MSSVAFVIACLALPVVLFFSWFFFGAILKVFVLWGPSTTILMTASVLAYFASGIAAGAIFLVGLIAATQVYHS